MLELHKLKINLGFLVNPFFLYCIAFSLAFFVYLWGWSDIYPKLSIGLILFLASSFLFFIWFGYIFGKKDFVKLNQPIDYRFLNDFIFGLIILLGITNVLLMGYLPILDRSHDYREFGIPVLDPLFNTLSIFFSVFFVQSFIEQKKRRLLIYVIIIIVFHIIIFRRSSVLWIVTSSIFLIIYYKRRISILVIAAVIIILPILSYCFGAYGNVRSNLSKSFILNELGASEDFKNSNRSYNHYMTYLYVSSPLANLQKNIDEGHCFTNRGDYKDFLFYCVIPGSITMRLEERTNLEAPLCSLITPDLIVGTFFMLSFYTLGWLGMAIMILFLLAFIALCLLLIQKFDTFKSTTLCILSTAVSLLIFTNFLNRLDVVIMLLIYPAFFHFIYTKHNVLLSAIHKKGTAK